jgi:hypothetical protein
MDVENASKAAATLGSRGGRCRSAAQAEARRRNGARGGRPSARCLDAEARIARARIALAAGAVVEAAEILANG